MSEQYIIVSYAGLRDFATRMLRGSKVAAEKTSLRDVDSNDARLLTPDLKKHVQ